MQPKFTIVIGGFSKGGKDGKQIGLTADSFLSQLCNDYGSIKICTFFKASSDVCVFNFCFGGYLWCSKELKIWVLVAINAVC